MDQSLKRNLLSTEKILDIHRLTPTSCLINDVNLILNIPPKKVDVTTTGFFCKKF